MIQDILIDNKLHLLIYFISIIFCHIIANNYFLGIYKIARESLIYGIGLNTDRDDDQLLKAYKNILLHHSFVWTTFIHFPILFIIFKYNIQVEWYTLLFTIILGMILYNKVEDNFVDNIKVSSIFHLLNSCIIGFIWLGILNHL